MEAVRIYTPRFDLHGTASLKAAGDNVLIDL
jgi:hypothetical protein